MIKKILISVVFLLLIVVGGVYFYFDALVKSGVEVAGSSVLGTAVTVEGVSISPLNGQGDISGLRVEKPGGLQFTVCVRARLGLREHQYGLGVQRCSGDRLDHHRAANDHL